jgi:hypothetical protein
MLAALISGLAIAILTGLTILAYRHPAGYKKLGIALMAILTVGIFAILLWDSAIEATVNELRTFFKDGSALQVGEAVTKIQIPMSWAFGIWAGSLFYLMFLFFLPDILGLEKRS